MAATQEGSNTQITLLAQLLWGCFCVSRNGPTHVDSTHNYKVDPTSTKGADTSKSSKASSRRQTSSSLRPQHATSNAGSSSVDVSAQAGRAHRGKVEHASCERALTMSMSEQQEELASLGAPSSATGLPSNRSNTGWPTTPLMCLLAPNLGAALAEHLQDPAGPSNAADSSSSLDLLQLSDFLTELVPLARGSGGVVYQAKWHNAQVAVKFCVSDTDTHLQRSYREALLTRCIAHPYLVTCYSAGTTRITPSMWQEAACGNRYASGSRAGSATHRSGARSLRAFGADGATAAATMETIFSNNFDGRASEEVLALLRSVQQQQEEEEAEETCEERDAYYTCAVSGASQGANAAARDEAARSKVADAESMPMPSLSLRVNVYGSSAQGQAAKRAAGGLGKSGAEAAATGGVSALELSRPGQRPPLAVMDDSVQALQPGNPSLPSLQYLIANLDTAAAESHPTSTNEAPQAQQQAMPQAMTPDQRSVQLHADAAGGQQASTSAIPSTGAASSFTVASPHTAHAAQGSGQEIPGVAGGSSGMPLFTVLQDIGAKPGKHLTCVVMEYCDAGTLLSTMRHGVFSGSSRVQDRPRLLALLATALEVAQAMAYLHSIGLQHGDLKPSNVLLKSSPLTPLDDRGFTARVSDLGLARPCPTMHPSTHTGLTASTEGSTPAGSEARTHTQSSNIASSLVGAAAASLTAMGRSNHGMLSGMQQRASVMSSPSRTAAQAQARRGSSSSNGSSNLVDDDLHGTIQYMAPEALHGNSTRARDVYSFGALLWHMAHGRTPFAQMRPAQILAGLATGSLRLTWQDDAPSSADANAGSIGASSLRTSTDLSGHSALPPRPNLNSPSTSANLGGPSAVTTTTSPAAALLPTATAMATAAIRTSGAAVPAAASSPSPFSSMPGAAVAATAISGRSATSGGGSGSRSPPAAATGSFYPPLRRLGIACLDSDPDARPDFECIARLLARMLATLRGVGMSVRLPPPSATIPYPGRLTGSAAAGGYAGVNGGGTLAQRIVQSEQQRRLSLEQHHAGRRSGPEAAAKPQPRQPGMDLEPVHVTQVQWL